MQYYTNVGTSIRKQVNDIKNELKKKNVSPDYKKIETTIDLIEKQLVTLKTKYNTNLNQYSKFTMITPNMRNAVVVKRDDILKNLNLKRTTNVTLKVQAKFRGDKNRKKAAEMRRENNNMRAKLNKRLNAILNQIGNNNKSPQ